MSGCEPLSKTTRNLARRAFTSNLLEPRYQLRFRVMQITFLCTYLPTECCLPSQRHWKKLPAPSFVLTSQFRSRRGIASRKPIKLRLSMFRKDGEHRLARKFISLLLTALSWNESIFHEEKQTEKRRTDSQGRHFPKL